MSVLSKLIVAVTAARALAIQQPPRLTPCLAINPPSIPAPNLPKSISRHPAIVLLNRVLLEPSECEAAAEDELVARLSPDDPRTIHVREHLKAESGQELRAGLLDAGATDSAQLEWVASDAGAPPTTVKTLQLRLSPAKRLLKPLAAHERPRVDLLLAMPRPLQFGRLLPMLSSMGVDTLWLTEADRVPKNYFGSQLLRPERKAELRAALVNGLEQSGDTAVPRCLVRRNLKALLRDELPKISKQAPGEASTGKLIRLVCHPERLDATTEPPVPIGEALADVSADDRVLLAIGPERGWAEPEELELFAEHGFTAVTLGPRTLRTDVAAISLLAVTHERLEAARRRGM